MNRLDLAIKAAKEAGAIHLKYFGQSVEASNKNPRDIVTVADTESEQHIISQIKAEFPADSILAEESGSQGQAGKFRWIVDPLDGTSNFFKGSPDFCVLIALVQNGTVVFGVTWFPVTEELYVAEKGKGATRNGEALSVSKESSLANCYGNTHMSSKLDARTANLKNYENLIFKSRNIHVINACIARLLCDVATGRADFHFRVGMNFWDYAAGILLIEEAGGKVTDGNGRAYSEQSQGVIATNSLCHDELIAALTS